MDEAVALERFTICEATKPAKMEPAVFDASPLEARKKMASDASAWNAVCGD